VTRTPLFAIRTERYKLIHYVLEPQEFELYDLSKDPGETLNLYGLPQYLGLQQDSSARLEKLRAEVPERKIDSALAGNNQTISGSWTIGGTSRAIRSIRDAFLSRPATPSRAPAKQAARAAS
jgi:hypothetical protein